LEQLGHEVERAEEVGHKTAPMTAGSEGMERAGLWSGLVWSGLVGMIVLCPELNKKPFFFPFFR